MRFISYLRVPLGTDVNEFSLAKQRASIAKRLNTEMPLQEYVEFERRGQVERPQLVKALAHCKTVGATLVIARLGRLAANLEFTRSLMSSGVAVIACDMFELSENNLHLLVARSERRQQAISHKVRAGLTRTRQRGTQLGSPRNLTDHDRTKGRMVAAATITSHADQFAQQIGRHIDMLLDQGLSLRAIARELIARDIKTARGGTWTAATVRNIIKRRERRTGPHF